MSVFDPSILQKPLPPNPTRSAQRLPSLKKGLQVFRRRMSTDYSRSTSDSLLSKLVPTKAVADGQAPLQADTAASLETAPINHRGFPHIIETIVSYADRVTLLDLRVTCRHLHNVVDGLLARHLLLWQVPRNPIACLTMPYRKTLPSLAPFRAGDQAHMDRLHQLVSRNTQILDMIGHTGVLPFPLSKVHTVRVWQNPNELCPPLAPIAPNQITFAALPPATAFNASEAIVLRCQVPEAVRRHVLHLTCDSDHSYKNRGIAFIIGTPPGLEETVVLFSEHLTRPHALRHLDIAVRGSRTLLPLFPLIPVVAGMLRQRRKKPVKYTIVGVEDLLSPSLFEQPLAAETRLLDLPDVRAQLVQVGTVAGDATDFNPGLAYQQEVETFELASIADGPASSPRGAVAPPATQKPLPILPGPSVSDVLAYVRVKFLDAVLAHLSENEAEELAPVLSGVVEFLSREEYIDRVGETQYDLETVE